MQTLVDVAFGGAHHPLADPNCRPCQDYVPGKGWMAIGIDINCGGQVELCKCVQDAIAAGKTIPTQPTITSLIRAFLQRFRKR